MIVLKFGGSSVKNDFNEAVSLTKSIFEEKEVAVVVSALKGVTDTLIKYAETFNTKYAIEVAESYVRFARANGIDPKILSPYLRELFNPPPIPREALKDHILSIGELLSATIFAEAVDGQVIYPWELFSAYGKFGDGFIDIKKSKRNAKIIREIIDTGKIPVVPGFIGGMDGYRITLGRGGSDYSAVALGVILNSELVAIMSDVEGIFTADPKLVPSARLIPYLSYEEALVAAKHGMKAIQWKAAELAKEERILMLFGKTNNWRMGTVISDRTSRMPLMTYKDGLLLINVEEELGYRIIDEGPFWRLYDVPRDEGMRIIRELHKVIFGDVLSMLQESRKHVGINRHKVRKGFEHMTFNQSFSRKFY
ncbi:aspartate kinase [Pyrococcus sp. NA2]|uniref:aspartate kinase n=1 Tax=Pyrococcus sp. (strain NA2) TaxID=342949 RepID=UPI000209AB09|nr:aspartate kinase [Pyrococcus sp. NA2]AEC52626.1 aspartate kinase [Pyrococcus sp. NA2]